MNKIDIMLMVNQLNKLKYLISINKTATGESMDSRRGRRMKSRYLNRIREIEFDLVFV